MQNLPANQTSASTHLSVERAEHREWIGGRIITLLSHYWRDDDPIELTSAIGADWAEVLEGLPEDAIAKACTQYLREETRKPKPADIYQRARQFMPKPKLAPKPAEKPRGERVSPEAMARIRDKIGFSEMPYTPEIAAKPKAYQSAEKTEQNIIEAQKLAKEWGQS